MEKKKIAYYLNLDYPITIIKDKDDEKNYFEAEIPDLPGCGAHGETIFEALKNLEKAKKLWIEVSLKKGLPILEPVSEDEFSGRYLLRIPARLHMKLSLNAKKEGLSLNQYLRKKLETALTIDSLSQKLEALTDKVDKIHRIIGDSKVYSPIQPKHL